MEEEKKTNELKDVTKELLGWEDNKLFRTLNHLTTRPGQIVTEYCNGERQKYFSPIVYFFGVVSLDFYISSVIGLYDYVVNEQIDSLQKSTIDKNSADKLSVGFKFLMSETGQKIILIPILLLLTWLFYRKFNKSFKENSWFALYLYGHITLLSIPFMPFWYITNDLVLLSTFQFIIGLIYWVWASKQF